MSPTETLTQLYFPYSNLQLLPCEGITLPLWR